MANKADPASKIKMKFSTQLLRTFEKYSSRVNNEFYECELDTYDKNKQDHILKKRNKQGAAKTQTATSKKTKQASKLKSKEKKFKSVGGGLTREKPAVRGQRRCQGEGPRAREAASTQRLQLLGLDAVDVQPEPGQRAAQVEQEDREQVPEEHNQQPAQEEGWG